MSLVALPAGKAAAAGSRRLQPREFIESLNEDDAMAVDAVDGAAVGCGTVVYFWCWCRSRCYCGCWLLPGVVAVVVVVVWE